MRQDQSYRDEVLPPSCRKRVAIEAGVTMLWYQFRRIGRESRRDRSIRYERPRWKSDD